MSNIVVYKPESVHKPEKPAFSIPNSRCTYDPRTHTFSLSSLKAEDLDLLRGGLEAAAFLANPVPRMRYYEPMIWEGFFLNPRPEVLEKVKITLQELEWIVSTNATHQDDIIEWSPSYASLVVVPDDRGVLSIVSISWRDNQIHLGRVIPPIDESHWLFRDFTHYKLISPVKWESDLRWK